MNPTVNVLCGHWVVRDALNQRCDRRFERATYDCVSQCGVQVPYPRSAVTAGKLPATCWACRPGVNSEPGRVVVTGRDLETHLKLWESGMNVRSNLKGKAAVVEWDRDGMAAVTAVLALSPLGTHFGWQLWVRDCHEQPAPREATVVRVRGFHESQRRIELSVRAATGRYTFEVDLTWPGRRDTPFAEVSASVTAGIAALVSKQQATQSAAASPGPEVEPPPVTAVTPAQPVFGNLSLEQLLLIRNGADKLYRAGEESQTLATARAEAEGRMRAADQASLAAHAEARRVREEAAALVAEESGLTARVADLRDEIRRAEERLAVLCRAVPAADEEAIEAERAAAEAAADRDLVQLELDEIAASEQTLKRSLAGADDVLHILAALSKMK